jgi:hypothetical protein
MCSPVACSGEGEGVRGISDGMARAQQGQRRHVGGRTARQPTRGRGWAGAPGCRGQRGPTMVDGGRGERPGAAEEGDGRSELGRDDEAWHGDVAAARRIARRGGRCAGTTRRRGRTCQGRRSGAGQRRQRSRGRDGCAHGG